MSGLRPRELLMVLKDAVLEWDRDNVSRLAAALAYYAIFSMAPLLVIAIGIGGLLFGKEAAQGRIVTQFQQLIGQQGAETVQTMMQRAAQPGTGLMATVLGLVTLLLGASGVFGQLQSGLNTVWEVAPRPGRVVKGLLRTRFLSFTLVLGTGFLLLVSLVLSAAVAAFSDVLTRVAPWLPVPPSVLDSSVSFLVTVALFAMIYKLLPDVEIAWRDVWLGAGVTSLLFTLGKHLIGLYLGNSSIGSTYGAAGTLAVLLLWIYYSAQIFYFGAEITEVYAKRRGSPIKPARFATPIMSLRVGYDSPESIQADVEAARRRAELRLDRNAAAQTGDETKAVETAEATARADRQARANRRKRAARGRREGRGPGT